MISILFLLVLGLALLTGRLAWSQSQLRRSREEELRQLEARWAEKTRHLETLVAGKASAEDLKNLAEMIDGAATAGIRVERRVTRLEASPFGSPGTVESKQVQAP
jgi:hypothetical protein